MTYDFDTPIDRSGTYSLKWEEAGDALPMWVADMDFQTAPVIREALRRRVEHGVFGYSIVPPEWNQAYVDWWGRRHGLAIDRIRWCSAPVWCRRSPAWSGNSPRRTRTS